MLRKFLILGNMTRVNYVALGFLFDHGPWGYLVGPQLWTPFLFCFMEKIFDIVLEKLKFAWIKLPVLVEIKIFLIITCGYRLEPQLGKMLLNYDNMLGDSIQEPPSWEAQIYMALDLPQFHGFAFGFYLLFHLFSDFQLFRPEHH
jgi:hypothetical protein